MSTPRARPGAAELARRIRAGVVDARTLLEQHLDRIARFDPVLNAIVVLRAEAARARADAADADARRGRWWGPLHGVPITIKECFDWVDTPSTFGRPERSAHRPGTDAIAVRRLLEAGAIVMGKTNVPLDLADWQTVNEVYGLTRNPWSRDHSPGGSSGGAATALAAGLSALELGSDNSGSIRMPAHFCGVYGHKPTYGIVPTGGHSLSEQAPPDDVNVVGPLARCAEDLDLAMRVLAGPVPPHDRAWSLRLPEPTQPDVRGLRVAVLTTDTRFPVDRDTQAAARAVAATLEQAGAQVCLDPALPAASTHCYEVFMALARGATSARLGVAEIDALRPRAAALSPDDRGPEALRLRGLTQSHRDWLERNAERERLRSGWASFFTAHDLLIAPVSPTPAFPHRVDVPKSEHRLDVDGVLRPAADTYFWIGLASGSGLPATAIPAGRSASGLPIGLQVIGPEYHDLHCIALARALESLHRGFEPPPGFA